MDSEQELHNVILFQIERTNKLARAYSQREFDRLGLGITIEQWVILKIIEENAPLSQTDLAKESLRDPASITRTLDLLEKKGFILRKPILHNRRQYNIILTKEGEAFVEQNMKVVHDHRMNSIKGFDKEELKAFQSMLLRMQKNFE